MGFSFDEDDCNEEYLCPKCYTHFQSGTGICPKCGWDCEEDEPGPGYVDPDDED